VLLKKTFANVIMLSYLCCNIVSVLCGSMTDTLAV